MGRCESCLEKDNAPEKRLLRNGNSTHCFPLDGMKLSAVVNFVIKCGGDDVLKGLTTEQVNNIFQKEFTKDVELSYCDMVKSENCSKVGKATVFISHAWKYKFMDLLSALASFP